VKRVISTDHVHMQKFLEMLFALAGRLVPMHKFLEMLLVLVIGLALMLKSKAARYAMESKAVSMPQLKKM